MTDITGLVGGLHHITLVTSNEETNRRFYTELLGLRRVKLTVNQDDIYHRHLFYADEKGTTGSAITFFEWPELPSGRAGLGSPHHLCYAAPHLEAIPRWKAWLSSRGVPVTGPLIRDGKVSIYLRDPDGVTVEITALTGETVSQEYLRELTGEVTAPKGVEPEMRLTIFDHASPISSDGPLTSRFLEKFLGLRTASTRPNPDDEETSIVAVGNSDRPDFLRYLSRSGAADGIVGRGSIHHIAVAVEGDEEQRKILYRLNESGIRNSGVIDRFWFHSVYFRDPDGNLLEVATKNPGYSVDESPERLGTGLVLPEWLEPRREQIEKALTRTDEQNKGPWPPRYPGIGSRPEALAR